MCARVDDEQEEGRGGGIEVLNDYYHSTISSRLSEAVTPLLSTPYSEQLTRKEKAMSEFLKKMAKRISSKDSYPVKLGCAHLCLVYVIYYVITERFSGKMVF